MMKHKTIIGRYEFIELKDFLAFEVPAKIDTGAYFSAINASDILVTKINDRETLTCKLLAGHKAYPYSRDFSTTQFEKRSIENSFGVSEVRYIVILKIKLAGKVIKTPFSLADRSSKTFPILLGRKLLNSRYIVDTSTSNINKKFIERFMPKALNDEEGHIL